MRTTTSTRRAATMGIGAVIALVLTACQWSMPRFDAAGSGSNSVEVSVGVGNVAALGLVSSAVAPGPTTGGTPVVAGDVVYVTSSGADGAVRAYEVTGRSRCIGAPATCTPLWSAPGDAGQAAAANGVLFVAIGSDLHAYDAAGTAGCSGSPTTCSPLWTAPGWGGEPIVADGRLYVSQGRRLGSFDAAGSVGCTGTPTICSPSWTYTDWDADSISPPVVADGVVYVGVQQNDVFLNGGYYGGVRALDASGAAGCGGTPTACEPLWTGIWSGAVARSPAVVDGVLYVSGFSTYEVDDPDWGIYQSGHTSLSAFDVGACASAGWCVPLWQARTEMDAFAPPYSVAVADGFVHTSWSTTATGPSVATFPVDGGPGCGGTVTCAPVRLSPSPSAATAELSVANDVLYVGRTAFDATGATGCGGSPTVCTPIWTAPVPTTGNRTFLATNGTVIGLVDTGADQTLTVFDTP